MIVKKNMNEIIQKLEKISNDINDVVKDYIDNYADYGWDNFSETLANVSAQIFMQNIVAKNAEIKKDRYL